MATKVDELVVEIRAETDKLRKGLANVNKSLERSNKTAKASVLTFGNLAKVFAAIGFVRLGGAVVNTSRTFEDLGATMKAITGDAQGAAKSMDLVRKFTSGTTFQLENVSSAFITLLNAGITPTSDTLTDFGNLAAAFGKDITQIAQATFNATTGETEMLKQFGIKAKLEGDKISMIFREQETVIGRNSTEIVQYLRNIAQENFATALEERANTVSGVFSNLGDASSELMNAIGEGGLNSILIEVGRGMLNNAEEAKILGQAIGEGLRKAFDGLKTAIGFVVANLNSFIGAIGIFLSLKFALTILAAASAGIKLVKSLGLVRLAMLALNKVSKANIFLLLALGVGSLTGALDKLGEKIQTIVDEVSKNLGLDDLFDTSGVETKELEDLNKEIEKIAGNLKDTNNAAKETTVTLGASLKDSITSASQAFTGEFVDALMESKSVLESFGNFAKAIVKQIITTFLQMAVVNRILNAVFGLTGNAALPTLGGGGGGASGGTPMVTAAGGGRATKGHAMLVGERGPELFVPPTHGRIMNNADSRSAMGGGGIVINQSLNFSTGVVPTVRAEVSRMLPQISDVTKNAVLESTMRGGAFRKGIRGT